jgi:hypothetical protein
MAGLCGRKTKQGLNGLEGSLAMNTTPETIARLRRLHAESETMAGMHEYTSAACHELPGLLADLEASQKREQRLASLLQQMLDDRDEWDSELEPESSFASVRRNQSRDLNRAARAALATEAK